MTTNRLSETAGGITTVVMNRARLFLEVGIEARLVSIAFDPNLATTVRSLKRHGRLSADTRVFNHYSYYAAICDRTAAGRWDHDAALDVEACEEPCAPGDLTRRQIWDEETGKVKEEQFFSPAGWLYLTYFFASQTGRLNNVSLTDARKPGIQEFRNKRELHAYFLSELARKMLPCVLIADAGSTASAVLATKAKGVFRILTLHGNHFARPFTWGAPIAKQSAAVLAMYSKADALVLLTPQQRVDIARQFGHESKVYSLPNSVADFPPSPTVVERDPHLVVSLAQYRLKKNLREAIEAFSSVVAAVPEARLELYGQGSQENELRELVERRNLSHAVQLKGYTTDPATVLRRAGVFISTSESEGFGLSIAEALALGTPVVSYDCPYGPREIVRDGVDGYLVHGQDMFIERIVQLLQNPVRARAMGEAGRANVQRFSAAAVREHWLTLFQTLRSPNKSA